MVYFADRIWVTGQPQCVAVFFVLKVSCGVPKIAPISHRFRTDQFFPTTRSSGLGF